MTSVYFSPCPLFPGEVENYYCSSCHVTCSGLSLLVGPHTGHNCVPLLQATKYLPATLHRDADTLAAVIQEQYMQSKKSHCTTLENTLNYMKIEREKKQKEIEMLQKDLCLLDEKIETITQEWAVALCQWSHKRKDLLCKARRLLRGADVLANIIGLREKRGQSFVSNITADAEASNADISPTALQAIEKELRGVRQLLTQPLKLLEKEEKDENEKLENGQQQRDFSAIGNALFATCAGKEKENESYCWSPICVNKKFYNNAGKYDSSSCHSDGYGYSSNTYKNDDDKLMSSDAADVLQQFFSLQKKSQKTSFVDKNLSFSGPHYQEHEQDDVASRDDIDERKTVEERLRWRRDVELKERLLREGLNRCLHSSNHHAKRTVNKLPTGDESDENDISTSSGGSLNGGFNHFSVQLR